MRRVFMYRKAGAQGIATAYHPCIIEDPAWEILGLGLYAGNGVVFPCDADGALTDLPYNDMQIINLHS